MGMIDLDRDVLRWESLGALFKHTLSSASGEELALILVLAWKRRKCRGLIAVGNRAHNESSHLLLATRSRCWLQAAPCQLSS